MTKRIDASVNPPWYVNVEFEYDRKNNRPLPVETGAPIDVEAVNFPRTGYSEKKRKRMPDLIVRWEIVLVSGLVKSAIEELEPDVHQFIPFELRNGKRGEPTEDPYYLLNVAQQATSIDLERSSIDDVSLIAGEESSVHIPSPSVELEKVKKKFVMKADLHHGFHLWREKWDYHCFYMSDELFALCKNNGAKGLEIQNEFEDL